MAYGTALASFNVEEFGVERVARLTSDEIAERVAELAADHELHREAGRAARLKQLRRALSAPAGGRDKPRRIRVGSRDVTWGFLWLMLALKIPLAALIYIVWWAIKQEPEQSESSDDDGGVKRNAVRHPRKPFPRRPRRGPHGDPGAAAACARAHRSRSRPDARSLIRPRWPDSSDE